MSNDGYKIVDEPSPGALAHLTVSPFWPLVAVMFSGAWISWGWFLINGIAVGSPTLRREMAWIASGLIVGIVLVYSITHFALTGVIPKEYIKYVLLMVVTWKLAVSYVLFSLQSHSIELYEYYGGKLRNGIVVIVIAYFISPLMLKGLSLPLRLLLA